MYIIHEYFSYDFFCCESVVLKNLFKLLSSDVNVI